MVAVVVVAVVVVVVAIVVVIDTGIALCPCQARFSLRFLKCGVGLRSFVFGLPTADARTWNVSGPLSCLYVASRKRVLQTPAGGRGFKSGPAPTVEQLGRLPNT